MSLVALMVVMLKGVQRAPGAKIGSLITVGLSTAAGAAIGWAYYRLGRSR
jgi:hypothetical protein